MSEVKTKQTAWEVWDRIKILGNFGTFESGWNAALASVETTGRFEVGDNAQRSTSGTHWEDGKIIFLPNHVRTPDQWEASLMVSPNDKFRPVPKMVDLTVEEKRVRLMNAICEIKQTSKVNALGIIIDAMYASQDTGKSLDDLCREYSVPLIKEVS